MSEEVIDVGSRRELFVDHFLIEELAGTQLKLQRPQLAEVAIRYDQPQENIFSFYGTVLKDGDTYRMYYRGNSSTCCAESRDGINWTKPDLGLFPVNGSTRNNIILDKGRAFTPFIDTQPGVSSEERYKATETEKPGLAGYVSADGLRWRRVCNNPIIPTTLENNFDSMNVMFWSQAENCYVLYARHMEGGRRSTARATSTDFLSWSDQTLMTYSDTGTTTPSEHLYTNQTQPYFRAPHIYVSLAARILFADVRHIVREDDIAEASRRTSAVTPEMLNFFKNHVDESAGAPGDIADGVFLTTRAGSTCFDFTFKESFVRPGIGLNNWTTRNNYPGCGVVQTGPAEMSFYLQRDYAQKTAHVQRLTLRVDGFTSVHAPYEGGEMQTRPMTFSGRELEINYSTSAAGNLRVEIQDASGQPIPGFTLAECPEIYGDHIERIVVWKNGSDVSRLANQPIRLKFALKDADLYSIRFQT